MSGRQPRKCSKGATSIGDMLVVEERVNRRIVDVSGNERIRQDRLSFRCKPESGPVEREIERLLADPIPCEQESLTPHVPECEREHPPEHLHAFVPSVFVKVDYYFRIRMGCEVMPFADQRTPKLAIVVDLAVENHDN